MTVSWHENAMHVTDYKFINCILARKKFVMEVVNWFFIIVYNIIISSY